MHAHAQPSSHAVRLSATVHGPGLCDTKMIQGASKMLFITLFGLLLSLPHINSFTIQHRVLVLTIPSFDGTNILEEMMDAYGIPFDVLPWTSDINMQNILYASDKVTAKYSAVYMYPALDTPGPMTAAQVRDFQAYRVRFGVRLVRFGAQFKYWGLTPVNAATTAAQDLTFTGDMPLGVSGVRRDAKLTLEGVFREPAARHNLGNTNNCGPFGSGASKVACTVTVVAHMARKAALGGPYVNQTVIGIQATYGAGLQDLAFGLDLSSWQSSCWLLVHATLSWALHNIIPGQRRTLLNTQVDDVLLDTWTGQGTCNDPVGQYRLTPRDLRWHANWQARLNSKVLPPGSNFTLELAFNGNGALVAARSPATISQDWDGSCGTSPQYSQLGCKGVDSTQEAYAASRSGSKHPFCMNCTKNWKRPADPWGQNRMPQGYSTAGWDRAAIQRGDPLSGAIMTNATLADAFSWVTHTFTHLSLNNATGADTRLQWQLNKQMAALLRLRRLSQRGVVTSAISGLTNANALRQTAAAGYTAAVGDNTWAFLRNKQRPYWMRITSLETHNYAGWRIVPRAPTEIYYCAASIEGETRTYAAIYPELGSNPSIDQILEREADRMLLTYLLPLRQDPHMMHQANMMVQPWPGSNQRKSLLTAWVDKVVGQLLRYVTWPVQTLAMDTLIEAFAQREQRDKCQLTYTLTVDDITQQVTRVDIRSSPDRLLLGPCFAPLLLRDSSLLVGALPGPPAGAGAAHRVAMLPPGGSAGLPAAQLPW